MADDTPTTNVSQMEPTPAPAPSSSSSTTTTTTESSNGNVAITMVGRPTPSPELLLLLPQPLSSSNSGSVSFHADHNVEISGKPSCCRSGANADIDTFISTPSPFRKQKSTLTGTNANDDKSVTKNSSDVNEYDPTQLLLGKAIELCVRSPSESNFQGDHLLSGSLLQSPDPLIGNNDASTIDFEFLGQEVMAAASTASAMLSRYDGFDPMPAYSRGMDQQFNDAAPTSTTDPTDGLGVNLFSQYPYQDAFPLPPYLQVHLDETHAESNAVAACGYDERTETGESPMNGYDLTSAPGTTPPSVSSGSASRVLSRSEGINVGSRGKTLEQLAQAKKNVKHDKTRPRPLPLRKRKFVMNDSDDDEYQPPCTELVAAPASKKRTLVRHNVRADDGDRITCKCSKSKCLKLYCDCFQQGKVCSPTECECKGCKNTQANSGPYGIRTKTIEEIMLRRPDAFEPRTRDADEGCRCKKNRCLKKYCICFNQGIACDSKCRCKNCENQPGQNHMEEASVPVKIEVEPKLQRVSKVQPESVTSSRVSFDGSIYGEPPKLPGGYTYGYGSPSHLTPDAGETALV